MTLNIFFKPVNSLFGKQNYLFKLDGAKFISTIGFIGLGNMGKPMAENLLRKGYNMTVYDVNASATKGLSEGGANVASSLAEAVSNADCVITMLTNNQQVMDSYSGKDGIISHVKENTMLLDASTVDPKVPKALGPLAEKKGASFLDTPVSGGVMAAQSAQLTFMIGGSENGAKRVDEVLHTMGRNVFYCGPLGSGQATKICNNMLLGITMAALSEAMNLGIRLGLDPKLLTSVINTSSGRCWSSDVYNPVPNVLENVPSARNYKGGFTTKMLVKDLNLARDVAVRSLTPTLLGTHSLKMYERIIESGHGDLDFSVIYDFLKNNKLNF